MVHVGIAGRIFVSVKGRLSFSKGGHAKRSYYSLSVEISLVHIVSDLFTNAFLFNYLQSFGQAGFRGQSSKTQ